MACTCRAVISETRIGTDHGRPRAAVLCLTEFVGTPKVPTAFDLSAVSATHEERERRVVRRSAQQPFLMVIALFLMATFVAMIPFTYASAIDPTWLNGIYDDADYDEIVRLLTETSGVGTNPVHPAAESLTFITRIVIEGMNEPPQRVIPRSILPRSPPTQTVSAFLRLMRLTSPSHSAAAGASLQSIQADLQP